MNSHEEQMILWEARNKGDLMYRFILSNGEIRIRYWEFVEREFCEEMGGE